MQRRPCLSFGSAALLSLIVIACGGDDNPAGPSGDGSINLPNGSMSATINGTPWNATLIAVNFIAPSAQFEGIVTILGTDAAQRSISVTARSGGPGTYTVGGTSSTNMFVADANGQGWQAQPPFPGSSGTVTFTTMTANRAVGTFTFFAVPATATGASGNMNVTSGRFDVTY
jgi:Family of unknown function (DUF6252)